MRKLGPGAIFSGALALGVSAALLMRNRSSVGRWRSPAGRAAYLARYWEAFEALPAAFATVDLPTSFGTVRVYRFDGAAGRVSPLVLLPGRASGTPIWSDLLPHLLAVGTVYAVDLLGEPGLSAQERAIGSDGDQAQWLDEAFAALPEERFHMVGLSMGGWLATNLALLRPGRVASLSLIDPMNVLADLPLATILRSIPVAIPILPKRWRDGFNSWTAGGVAVTDDPIARMIESGMANYAIRLPQPRRLRQDELGSLRMPVLAIVAGRSVMHHGADARETAMATFGAAAVRYYPEASHAISSEQPREVANDIVRFIRDCQLSDR